MKCIPIFSFLLLQLHSKLFFINTGDIKTSKKHAGMKYYILSLIFHWSLTEKLWPEAKLVIYQEIYITLALISNNKRDKCISFELFFDRCNIRRLFRIKWATNHHLHIQVGYVTARGFNWTISWEAKLIIHQFFSSKSQNIC